ncbi:MAG: hypothetical protein RLP44_08795 [Aggregatilineales bacterium]
MSAEPKSSPEKPDTPPKTPEGESSVGKPVKSSKSPLPAEKKEVIEKTIQALQAPTPSKLAQSPQVPIIVERADASIPPASPKNPPWTLQQFFNDEIDLDVELATRFQNMPVLSIFRERGLGTKSGRGVATLSSGDGAAQVIFDADATTKTVQMSFTFGAMLTLRFSLDSLTDANRDRWLALMRRREGGLSFLWGPSRWEHDYLICISRQYHTNIYAFSPNNFEAGARMTPDVLNKLLDWLDKFWNADDADGTDESPDLLTW